MYDNSSLLRYGLPYAMSIVSSSFPHGNATNQLLVPVEMWSNVQFDQKTVSMEKEGVRPSDDQANLIDYENRSLLHDTFQPHHFHEHLCLISTFHVIERNYGTHSVPQCRGSSCCLCSWNWTYIHADITR